MPGIKPVSVLYLWVLRGPNRVRLWQRLRSSIALMFWGEMEFHNKTTHNISHGQSRFLWTSCWSSSNLNVTQKSKYNLWSSNYLLFLLPSRLWMNIIMYCQQWKLKGNTHQQYIFKTLAAIDFYVSSHTGSVLASGYFSSIVMRQLFQKWSSFCCALLVLLSAFLLNIQQGLW